MKATRFLSVIFFLFALSSYLFGQSLTCTKGLEINQSDLTPRSQPRYDQNKKPAAVIRVNSILTGLVFHSGTNPTADYVIGNVDYEAGQYVVYIAEGAKYLEVRKEGYLPFKLVFADKSSIKEIKKETAYVLEIGELTGTLEIVSNPTNAEVFVDDIFIGYTPLSQKVSVGTHVVKVKKNNYQQYDKKINIEEEKSHYEQVYLSSANTFITIQTDESTDIYIDGRIVGRGNYSSPISVGRHFILLQNNNGGDILKKEFEQNIESSTVINQKLLGTLSILNSKHTNMTDVNVTLTDLSSDNEYRTFKSSNSVVGKYKISVSKPECWEEIKYVTVNPGSEVEYKLPRMEKRGLGMLLEYRFSPRAIFGFMVGWCGKVVGVYGSISGNLGSSKDSINAATTTVDRHSTMDYSADNNTEEVTNSKSGAFGIRSFQIHAGPVFRCCRWLFVYVGVGYGSYECFSNTYYNIVPDTKGFDAEAGLIFAIRHFHINVGYGTICNSSAKLISPLSNISFGIGYSF